MDPFFIEKEQMITVTNASYQNVKPLDASYDDLVEISRCVHFDDFEEAVRFKMLVPQPLIYRHKSKLPLKVLWFAPAHCSSEHNFYGNVSFTIKWETVQQKLGPNFYLIDQDICNARSFTRVVFTKQNYDAILEKVKLDSRGSPLMRSESGFRYASYCMNNVRRGPHELQIAIDVTDADAKWLYLNCKPVANNHYYVNISSYKDHIRRDGMRSKFSPHSCYKFNSAQNRECPYAWTVRESEKRIKELLGPDAPTTRLRVGQVANSNLISTPAAAAPTLYANQNDSDPEFKNFVIAIVLLACFALTCLIFGGIPVTKTR
ncbi:uncharacterized protein LOC108665560 [Hyalella azteca]|uniref:Uncharacterized protein LOC108665560 n=1 Tax=Hyalella azteca TaxID=294128 RepID=A0A8B7N1U3_HYAAZ|nr:uncharacterized protein LOC108665560 [Hyalella azteca]XP_018007818.1 uncharacterized protein LOC108665560 [Hyalella azteca]